jgi:hypothetical protein
MITTKQQQKQRQQQYNTTWITAVTTTTTKTPTFIISLLKETFKELSRRKVSVNFFFFCY